VGGLRGDDRGVSVEETGTQLKGLKVLYTHVSRGDARMTAKSWGRDERRAARARPDEPFRTTRCSKIFMRKKFIAEAGPLSACQGGVSRAANAGGGRGDVSGKRQGKRVAKRNVLLDQKMPGRHQKEEE